MTYDRYRARKANRWPLWREPGLEGTSTNFPVRRQRLVPFGGALRCILEPIRDGWAPLFSRRPIKRAVCGEDAGSELC